MGTTLADLDTQHMPLFDGRVWLPCPAPQLLLDNETERLIANEVEAYYVTHGYAPRYVLLSPLRYLTVVSRSAQYPVRSPILDVDVELVASAGMVDGQARCVHSIGTKQFA